MEPTPDLARLRALKDDGNARFKKQEWRQAFEEYTRAVDAGQAQLAGSPNLEFRTLLATCYSNRAAAGLKLHLYEQVVYDTERALRLLILPGCSEALWAYVACNRTLNGKAWARRGEAFLALGNVQQAQYCLAKGGRHLGDAGMSNTATYISRLHDYPAPYGHSSLPEAPHPRSSAALENVRTRTLRCRISRDCLFMSAVAWEGRVYCFGGHGADNPDTMFFSRPAGRLFVVDPKLQTARDLDLIRDDPESQRRYSLPGGPAPRASHTAVLWGSCMLVYAGSAAEPGAGSTFNLGVSQSFAEAERRTVWKLDLAGEPLQWQRLYCKDGPAPTLREAHSAVMWRDQMVIHGGRVEGTEVGDVWAFDPAHVRFKRLARSPEPRRAGHEASDLVPEARKEHAAWVSGDWMYIWGGSSRFLGNVPNAARVGNDYNFSDMWRFSLTEHRWEQVQPRGNPPGARGEVAYTTTSQGAFVLAGGYTGAVSYLIPKAEGEAVNRLYASTYLNDVYLYDPAANWWRVARTSDMQGPLGQVRAGSCAAWAGNNLYVVGGYIGYDDPEARREVVEVTLRCCARCGAGGKKLYLCQSCKAAGRAPTYYCSQECLRADWPVHKALCSDKGLLP